MENSRALAIKVSGYLSLILRTAYFKIIPNLLWGVLVCTTLTFDVPLVRDRDASLDRVLAGTQFNLVRWEIAALSAKATHELMLPQHGMTDAEQVAFVRETMLMVKELDNLNYEIDQIFISPENKNPDELSRDKRAKRDLLQRLIHQRQPINEAIIQEQIESVIREEGFELGGQIVPPLRFSFTGLPDVMIISRREVIERIDQRQLVSGISIETKQRLEKQVDEQFNVSSFITPIGGLGAYPTMLPQLSSVRYAIETAAHEWAHNFFVFRLAPIAINYTNDAPSRIINETCAVIFEREISKRVIAKYYPDLITDNQAGKGVGNARTTEQGKFDFNKEMRETRLRADELLAEGKIVQAENYMEERRAIFVKNGYIIRKLNQAYFAFYGAYNAEPGGSPTSGRDPIGPAVQRLRQQSATLGEFMERAARVRGRADLP